MFTSEDLEATAKDARELLRAKKVADRDKVRHLKMLEKSAVAEVAGSGKDLYAVELFFDLEGTCTCPSYFNSNRRWCKHLIAVGMAVLLVKSGEVFEARKLDTDLAEAVEAMTEIEARELLIEAGARFEQMHERIMNGDWGAD